MNLARREMLAGGAVILGAGTVLSASRNPAPLAPHRGPAIAAPPHGDMLVLLAGGRADLGSLRRFVAARPGRTVLQQVAPLTRDGPAEVGRLIATARHAHVIVLGDAAETLVTSIWLERAGRPAASMNISGLGEGLLARLQA